jgi:hypothetical protein
MLPWQKAKEWHDENDATVSFPELVGQHLSQGLVYSTDQVFLLASELRWNAEDFRFESGEPNCWFVRLAASAGHTNPVGEFMRVAPRPQQYAAWCRRGGFEPRIYDWNKLLRKTRG